MNVSNVWTQTVRPVGRPTVAPASRPTPGRVAGSAAGANGCGNTSLIPAASNVGAVSAATLCLINDARRAAGVGPLTENAALDRAAVGHADDMVAAGYFDHVGPDGRGAVERVLASGFPLRPGGAIGENIGGATLSGATPAGIFASWMGSPGHRANILSPSYSETGLGVAAVAAAGLGDQPGATYTEEFA